MDGSASETLEKGDSLIPESCISLYSNRESLMKTNIRLKKIEQKFIRVRFFLSLPLFLIHQSSAHITHHKSLNISQVGLTLRLWQDISRN